MLNSSILPNLRSLQSLKHLVLRMNKLEGQIEVQGKRTNIIICILQSRKHLNTECNGTLPADIEAIKNLEVLDLSYNFITGFVNNDGTYVIYRSTLCSTINSCKFITVKS